MDGWVDGWVDEWMDEWMDRWSGIPIIQLVNTTSLSFLSFEVTGGLPKEGLIL